MKRSVLMASVASIAASLLFASTGAQAADTLAKIAQSGKITLAYRESSVPFSYLEGPGKPIGIAVDLSNAVVEAVKKKLNKPDLQVALMPVTSQNRIPLITNGTIDLECGSTTNNTARGKEVAFAINHFYTGTRLLVKKSSNIKNYADLAKKTIASTTGTTNVLVMRKYNIEKNLGMDIVLGKDHADAFLLLESDRVVAFAMDDILLYGLIANAKTPGDYEVVGDSLQVEPYACMLPKDDPAFKKLVDDTFAGLMKSGEFEKLYNKWFMQPIPPKNVPLNLPMSPQLKENLKALSDKPAT
ncbi:MULTISPECIES: transporter substrate-binding domain-containing protein [Variovorax]|uniref:transporter substrate-binding domain-containing protein n=1 Tax=Variovorax atrisoli TaxID=3394203 RepID=UPI00119C060F|nr:MULTISPECIES: transporter substrate-binding domain-containing protein [Variovorax]MBB3639767.1 glutamate/aspartate transport system substrate-binding protein [Variovorax sp. BK613]MDR6523411.1 glutamate/aspartate transport system substrate-binding protein [Variovorax paradoxus]